MTTIAELNAVIGADISPFQKNLDRVQKRIDGFGKTMSGFGDIVGGALKTAAVGATAAIGGLTATIAKSVNVAGNLEQQAANISAVFGNMAPPVEEVKGLINDLSLDPKLVIGVQEAGAMVEMLAKNGLEWTAINEGAARSVTLLANATGADFAQSADIATNAIGIFGLAVSDLDNVVATFTNSANKSQFDVNDWGYVLANAGPAADQLNYKLEELFAAVTLTASGFASGREGGTSWEYLLKGLTPATDTAATAMKELGLMTEDGANAFFNADGSAKPLIETMRLLQGAFGPLTELQQQTYSEAIFGSTAFGALKGVLDLNIDAYKELVPQMTDFSAVEKGAETRTNTYQGAMAALGDTFNSVFSMIGDKFLPVFTKLARSFAKFVKENAQPIVDFFGRFADALGTFIDDTGNWLTQLSNTFSFHFAIITGENFTWGEKMLAVWDMLYQVGLKIWQSLLDGLLEMIPKWLNNLGEWALGLWEWIKTATPKAIAALGEWAKGLWDWLVNNLPSWIGNVANWAVALWQWIVDVTPTAVQKLSEWGNALITWLGANLPGWIATLLGWGTALWQWIGQAIPDAINGLAAFIAALRGEGDTSGLGQIGLMVYGWATKLWEWITKVALPQIWPAFMEYLGAVLSAGGNILGALGNLALELGKTLWHWIQIAAPIAFGLLRTLGTNLANIITAWVPQFGTGVTQLWMAIHSFFIAGSNLLQGNWRAAWENIKATGIHLWRAIEIAMQPIDTWLQKISGGFLTWKDIVIGAGLVTAIQFGAHALSIAGSLAKLVPGLNTVITLFGRIVTAGAPLLGWFALAVAAVALLRVAWENDWLGIQTRTERTFSELQRAFGPLLETIQKFGPDALKEIVAWAQGNETNFAATKRILGEAKETFNTVLKGITDNVAEWGANVGVWFQKHFPQSSNELIRSVHSIGQNFSKLWDELKILWTQTIGGWDGVVKAFEIGKGVIDGVIQAFIIAITTGVNNVLIFLRMITQMLNGDWAGAWESAKELVINNFTGMLNTIRTILNTILSIWGISIDDLIWQVTHWFQETRGTLRAMVLQFQIWFDDVTAPIRKWVDSFVTAGREAIAGLWRGIQQGWDAMMQPLRALYNSLPAGLRKVLESRSPSKVFMEIGGDITAGLAKGILDSQHTVLGAMGQLATGLTNVGTTSPYIYADMPAAANDDGALIQETNALLRILIAELRAKNMSPNVTVQGGGMGYGDLVGFTAGLR